MNGDPNQRREIKVLSFNLTLVIQMVGFLVFAWLFNQVFFRPVVQHIEARNRYLADQQASAERLIEDARTVRNEHDRRLREAQASAQAAVDAAVKEAQARRSERLAKARVEAQELVTKARMHLEKDRTDVLSKLRAEASGIAEAIATKVLAAKPSTERSREGAQA